MKKYLPLIGYSVLALGVGFFDRVTKWYAMHNCAIPKYVTDFLSCELTYNRGISWGLFHSANNYLFGAVSVVIACVTVVVAAMAWQQYKEGHLIVGELLVVTGSVSNLVDRVLYSGVVDFIHFHYAGWSWPVFNIADMAIVLGVGLMIYKQYRS